MKATPIVNVVESVDHLMDLCDDGISEFAIALNGGVRSSKNITWNGIDGSHERYTPSQFEKTFIHEAILARAFYVID